LVEDMDLVRLVQTVCGRRALVVELVRRQIKLRYRGTWLGFVWTLLNPLVFMVVYTLVISYFLNVRIPRFPAFLLCGLLPWTMWFAEGLTTGTSCLVDHAAFLRNAVFPSEVLPVAAVAAGMMNFVFSLPVLLVIFLAQGVSLKWTVAALPLVMLAQFLLMVGPVYLAACLEVFFRDMRFIVQHGLMVLFFLTPIMYDFSIVPPAFHWLLKLNPMTTVIDGYRQVLYYGAWPHWRNLGLVMVLGALLCLGAAFVFARKKGSFAEYL